MALSHSDPRGRSLSLRVRHIAGIALLFLSLSALLFGGTLMAPMILDRFAQTMPDNYVFRAEQALRRGDAVLAARIAQRRIDRMYWDMRAHFLLANALAAGGRPLEAADTILLAMHKVATAKGRDIRVTGFHEADSLQLLAGYLWDGGRYQYAAEMYRASIDAAADDAAGELNSRFEKSVVDNPKAAVAAAGVYLKLQDRGRFERAVAGLDQASTRHRARAVVLRSQWAELVDRNPEEALAILKSSSDSAPVIRLATAALLRRMRQPGPAQELERDLHRSSEIRTIGFESFSLPVGATSTSTSLELSRRGTAATTVQTGSFRVTDLLTSAAGSPAFGQYPIVVLYSERSELLRLYLDGLQPHVASVTLFPDAAPKELNFSVHFLNDAYDPVTRADRGVKFLFLGLH